MQSPLARAVSTCIPTSLSLVQLISEEKCVRLIGIGAAVTCRPLPHHRAYGSVHGGSRGYASSSRTVKEDRASGSKHSRLPRRELWSGPDTMGRDHSRPYWRPVAYALPVPATRPGDDVEFSTAARAHIAA